MAVAYPTSAINFNYCFSEFSPNSLNQCGGAFRKNRQDRLVVLNQVVSQVIREVKGIHPTYVFSYQGRCITRMLNSVWIKARIRAALPQVRVHDLKHIFGRRLRSAGVGFEDRQDLLEHKNGRITNPLFAG